MSRIAISETEYKDLLAYKEKFMELSGIQKKIGPAYRKYKEFKAMDDYFRTHYKEQYKVMRDDYSMYQEAKTMV